jgi:hypothetical protein
LEQFEEVVTQVTTVLLPYPDIPKDQNVVHPDRLRELALGGVAVVDTVVAPEPVRLYAWRT